jgi:NADH-quinone oxidoreductase subunit A
MLQELGNALAFIVLAALLPPVILFLSHFVRPSYPHSAKSLTYECGELPQGSTYIKFNNRFYMVAIVFLVFDVEVAMLFPVLTLLKGALGTPSALPILLLSFNFLTMLFLGLIYEWKIGDIDWARDFEDRKEALEQQGSMRAHRLETQEARSHS